MALGVYMALRGVQDLRQSKKQYHVLCTAQSSSISFNIFLITFTFSRPKALGMAAIPVPTVALPLKLAPAPRSLGREMHNAMS